VRRVGRFALIVLEIAFLTALILATRCANYQDVFVAGNVYFVDADCYARMTRAQMVRAKPGLVIRHHAFENFPQGTTPHTTAPLDYLIVALSFLLNAFTAHALDFAGAFVSPLLALLGGWFLWWWSRRMKFRYRWVMLILYAISPILVHGTELGRPDHQSLLILLATIAICAGWSSQTLQPANMAGAWWLTGAGDLGFGVRAPRAIPDRHGHRPCDESPRGFYA
jgi:asparagine N-glycosylation enzyme membrane subunit Stt3